jgi:hypothetical protein
VGGLIGYASCSTVLQDLTAQREILASLGVPPNRIHLDKALTGTTRARPGLDQALAAVRAGDTLVVPKLDRLARSVPTLPGLAGTTAVPASSALIVRARAFRAWLEPLIPALRRARLDTGLPAAASLLAAMRAWPMPDGIAVTALASWSCCGAVLVPAEGPDPARGAMGAAWSRVAPAWSSAGQAGDRDTAGTPVPLSGVSAAASASARSMCASAVPMARTRTGRQDTVMVTGHGARAAPAWASR